MRMDVVRLQILRDLAPPAAQSVKLAAASPRAMIAARSVPATEVGITLAAVSGSQPKEAISAKREAGESEKDQTGDQRTGGCGGPHAVPDRVQDWPTPASLDGEGCVVAGMPELLRSPRRIPAASG
jgi:hypothetical protein